jgi:hypothetical protein
MGQATVKRKKRMESVESAGTDTPWAMTLCVAGPERISVLRRGPGFGTMLHWIEEHE